MKSSSKHTVKLAADLIDDIELSRLSSESLLLKCSRLARLAGDEEIREWLAYELSGFQKTPVGEKYMALTGRWLDPQKQTGHWGSLAVQLANLRTAELELQALRVPDISIAASPPPDSGAKAPEAIVHSVMLRANILRTQIGAYSAIRGKVLSILHTFAFNVYYERVFSDATGSVFQTYQVKIDRLLEDKCGDVLKKFPSLYQSLDDDDEEAIPQTLATCRSIIDAFADAVYPFRHPTVKVGETILLTGPDHQQNRLHAFISEKSISEARKKKLRHTLTNLYSRVSTEPSDDVMTDEARALMLETYLFLGELSSLPANAKTAS